MRPEVRVSRPFRYTALALRATQHQHRIGGGATLVTEEGPRQGGRLGQPLSVRGKRLRALLSL